MVGIILLLCTSKASDTKLWCHNFSVSYFQEAIHQKNYAAMDVCLKTNQNFLSTQISAFSVEEASIFVRPPKKFPCEIAAYFHDETMLDIFLKYNPDKLTADLKSMIKKENLSFFVSFCYTYQKKVDHVCHGSKFPERNTKKFIKHYIKKVELIRAQQWNWKIYQAQLERFRKRHECRPHYKSSCGSCKKFIILNE